MNRLNNNFLDRTGLLELWPEEMLHPISNPIALPSVPLFKRFSYMLGWIEVRYSIFKFGGEDC